MELEPIQNKIYEIRGCRVMLDFDLARIYQVETRRLNEAVKRNIKRFPPDFMFQLTNQEFRNLMSQIAISSWGGTRKLPHAFSELGATMLSSVLKSDVAIEASILVVRAFVAVRQLAIGYAELNQKLENFMRETNMQFNEVYRAITELSEQKALSNKPMPQIGFAADRYRQK